MSSYMRLDVPAAPGADSPHMSPEMSHARAMASMPSLRLDSAGPQPRAPPPPAAQAAAQVAAQADGAAGARLRRMADNLDIPVPMLSFEHDPAQGTVRSESPPVSPSSILHRLSDGMRLSLSPTVGLSGAHVEYSDDEQDESESDGEDPRTPVPRGATTVIAQMHGPLDVRQHFSQQQPLQQQQQQLPHAPAQHLKQGAAGRVVWPGAGVAPVLEVMRQSQAMQAGATHAHRQHLYGSLPGWQLPDLHASAFSGRAGARAPRAKPSGLKRATRPGSKKPRSPKLDGCGGAVRKPQKGSGRAGGRAGGSKQQRSYRSLVEQLPLGPVSETELAQAFLRDDLRALLKANGISYHKQGRENLMKSKQEMANDLLMVRC